MAKIILGLAGEMGSGKGTVAKYLIEKYGAASFRGSDAIRDILDRLYLEQKRENFSLLSDTLRQAFGQDLWGRVVMGDAKKAKNDIVVFDGIRRLSDIENMKKMPNFKFIYVDASLETRYDRLVKRGENIGDAQKTLEEFKNDHELETELQIRNLKNHADVVVDNNGTEGELYAQVDQMIQNIINA